ADPEQLHRAEGHENPDRQHQDRHERTADVQQEDDAHERDDEAFLDQRVLERVNGRVNQVRAVVDRDDFDRLWQAGRDRLEALLDVLDHVQRVHAEALEDDAARDLALAIELGDAATLVRPKLDPGNVAQQHRRAVISLEHDVAEIVDAFQVALAADDILEFRQLDGAASDVGVAGADRIPHLLHGDAEIAHALRIEDHVVLLDEAADACDLGDTFRLGERKLQIPVLDRSRLRKIQLPGHHGVLVDPADAGRVRTD